MDSQVTQVTVIGKEFVAGREGNVQINQLLGMESGSFGGQVLRDEGGDELVPSPDFCGDEVIVTPMIDDCDIAVVIGPTEQRGKKPIEGFVGLFAIGEDLFCTEPQPSRAAAAACVLWFALNNKSVLTCVPTESDVCFNS